MPIDRRAERNGRQGVRTPLQEAMTVLDPETMQPVPWDGETMGEIMFRGNITMKGYLKNPGATEKAFAGGWFHTGDLAVMQPDGYVKIRDRSKDIIISGGENISSIEVEEALYRHPAVLSAAVVAQPDEKWGETPCAFVELKPDAAVTAEELRAFCREHLARFKVPKTFVFREIPKTSTGKIQKFVLREVAKSAERDHLKPLPLRGRGRRAKPAGEGNRVGTQQVDRNDPITCYTLADPHLGATTQSITRSRSVHRWPRPLSAQERTSATRCRALQSVPALRTTPRCWAQVPVHPRPDSDTQRPTQSMHPGGQQMPERREARLHRLRQRIQIMRPSEVCPCLHQEPLEQFLGSLLAMVGRAAKYRGDRARDSHARSARHHRRGVSSLRPDSSEPYDQDRSYTTTPSRTAALDSVPAIRAFCRKVFSRTGMTSAGA